MTLPFTPFLKEHLPPLQSRTQEEWKRTPTDEKLPPHEAELIDGMVTRLLHTSDEIRQERGTQPRRAVQALSAIALLLYESDAPAFRIAAALNETHANLHAAGMYGRAVKEIADLSLMSLAKAFPVVENDPYLTKLNRDEIETRMDAIQTTTPEISFPQALEDAWQSRGEPIDPLIDQTEKIIFESRRQQEFDKLRREQEAKKRERMANIASFDDAPSGIIDAGAESKLKDDE